MSTAYKKITSHGSISIPVAMRRELGIAAKDPMVVEADSGKIVISPYVVRCGFCGSQENVRKLNGRGICISCAEKAYRAFMQKNGGEQNE